MRVEHRRESSLKADSLLLTANCSSGTIPSMSGATFSYLRTHSYYSLKRAIPAPESLAEQAAVSGVEALVLADHGTLIGAVGFRRFCQQQGVKPIIGLTIPVAVELMSGLVRDELVLLARDPAGYRSLVRLSTHLQAADKREQWQQFGLPWSLLQRETDGVICLTGGQRGILWSLVAQGDTTGATRYLARLGGTFTEAANLSLEIHLPGDNAIAAEISRLGERFGLPAVAVQPVYHLAPDEDRLLPLLAAIDRNCELEAVPAAALANLGRAEINYGWAEPADLLARFAAFPEAIARTNEIAALCSEALPNGQPIWPSIGLPVGLSAQEKLVEDAYAGLGRRFLPRNRQLTPVNGCSMSLKLSAGSAMPPSF